MTTPKVIVLSDALGDTAEQVVNAGASQFNGNKIKVKKFNRIRTIQQIDLVFKQEVDKSTIVAYTLVEPPLRDYLDKAIERMGIPSIDIMGPVIKAFTETFHTEPKMEPGLQHKLDREYFQRVDAIEFTVKFDDRNDARGIELADVVLVGVSRTSKTPTCIYLAYKGYKAANIPLVPEVNPPGLLLENPGRKVIGLTIDPELLMEIRYQRLKTLGLELNADYASLARIQEELDYADRIMRRVGCPIIDVTNKSVEESANEVLNYIKD
ncbi:MAG: pyruvate, water dikinase regulatory protein [Halanaerobium sp.]|nr:pyruvate, water dikinase regulatory protein [Halanaerobium sp.]